MSKTIEVPVHLIKALKEWDDARGYPTAVEEGLPETRRASKAIIALVDLLPDPDLELAKAIYRGLRAADGGLWSAWEEVSEFGRGRYLAAARAAREHLAGEAS